MSAFSGRQAPTELRRQKNKGVMAAHRRTKRTQAEVRNSNPDMPPERRRVYREGPVGSRTWRAAS